MYIFLRRKGNMRGESLICCVVLVSMSLIEGDPIPPCPGARQPVRCYINPCDLPYLGTCSTNTALECRADYCLGCDTVNFYDSIGGRVTCGDSVDGSHKKKLD